jgi:arginine N-succinyltransferase
MPAPVTIRPIRDGDLQALQALADALDTVNLPDDPQALTTLVHDSQRSFASLDPDVRTISDPKHASFTLVAVGSDDGEQQVLGTASLFAYHGMPDEPHYYLKVVESIVHSRQLSSDRVRTVLKLGRDTEPWTELGGLVVRPQARGRGVGTLLVAARLLLVAMHAERFCRRLLAELLPARREDGGNAFWDSVGAPLTGLSYYRADLLCRSDKEFIDAFFPHEEIVVDLLPPAARALIGFEGPQTAPVRRLLQRAGFRYLGTVDPFDAGPHDGAEVAAVLPIQRSRRLVRLDLPPLAGTTTWLVANPRTHHMLSMPCEVVGAGVRISHEQAHQLGARGGDVLWAMPMDW